jgi:hypothetical protein
MSRPFPTQQRNARHALRKTLWHDFLETRSSSALWTTAVPACRTRSLTRPPRGFSMVATGFEVSANPNGEREDPSGEDMPVHRRTTSSRSLRHFCAKVRAARSQTDVRAERKNGSTGGRVLPGGAKKKKGKRRPSDEWPNRHRARTPATSIRQNVRRRRSRRHPRGPARSILRVRVRWLPPGHSDRSRRRSRRTGSQGIDRGARGKPIAERVARHPDQPAQPTTRASRDPDCGRRGTARGHGAELRAFRAKCLRQFPREAAA